MRRRRAVSLIGGGALGLRAAPSLARNPQWQPDGLGSVARIGVLTPAFDPVPESEMSAMAPAGVSVHASRVPRAAGSGGAFADPPHVDTAAGLLAELAPRSIVYAYTSSSYAQGVAADSALRTRLEARAKDIPVVLTTTAATDALRLLGVSRLALIHPPWFTEEVNEKGKEYFRAQGFDVVYCARLAPSRLFTEVSPGELYGWATANVPRQAQALFIGGNGLRAVGTIQALEAALGRPVVTANQVTFWRALQIAGVTSLPTHYGRLFNRGTAQR